MGKDWDNKTKRQHTEKEKSTAGTHCIKPSPWKWRWGRRTLGLGGNHASLFEHSGPFKLYVLFPSISFGSSPSVSLTPLLSPFLSSFESGFPQHIASFLLPPNYCPCQPFYSLNIIACVGHNVSPSPDLSTEKYIQQCPQFALLYKDFPTFPAGWGLPHSTAIHCIISKGTLVWPKAITPKYSLDNFINSPAQLLLLSNGEF